jgi:hypothetical protein
MYQHHHVIHLMYVINHQLYIPTCISTIYQDIYQYSQQKSSINVPTICQHMICIYHKSSATYYMPRNVSQSSSINPVPFTINYSPNMYHHWYQASASIMHQTSIICTTIKMSIHICHINLSANDTTRKCLKECIKYVPMNHVQHHYLINSCLNM